jgi:hypothetical protein
LESHLALQLVEKTARAALASRAFGRQGDATTGEAAGYARDAPENSEHSANDNDGAGGRGFGGAARPELLWNGPTPRAAVAWGGGGGGGHSRPAIGR